MQCAYLILAFQEEAMDGVMSVWEYRRTYQLITRATLAYVQFWRVRLLELTLQQQRKGCGNTDEPTK